MSTQVENSQIEVEVEVPENFIWKRTTSGLSKEMYVGDIPAEKMEVWQSIVAG